jgi:hypothetical protein
MSRLMTRVFAGIFIALLSASLAAGQSNRKFNVAVVRADGILIPFAQFDRGTWRPLWTGTERSWPITVPVTLDDVEEDWWRKEPPSLEWTLRRPQGEPITLQVSKPQAVYTPCSTQVALATDYKPSGMLPPPHQAPYPKLGIATTGDVDIAPIEAVRDGSIEWRRVYQALDEQGQFRTAENDTLADMGWSHPAHALERATRPIELQAVWHVKDSRFFYFEAMRRYPDRQTPKGKPACELVTYVAGYFWEERSEKLRPVGVGALITYCHMERASFLWPFGVIRDGAKQYWLFQSAGWTAESYGVAEPVPARGFIRHHLWHVAGRCRD